MIGTCRSRFHALALFTALTSVASPVWAELDLETLPLFSGTSAPPNVLLAVDDSGSMDYEILFPNDGGTLYWKKSAGRFTQPNSSGAYYTGGSDKHYQNYTYLFPNGCNHNKDRGRRTLCSDHYAIPPLPQFAYTRSPDYNKAYFNPAVTYEPWHAINASDPSQVWRNSDPEAAWYDPTSHYGDPVDLTAYIKEDGHYERFQVNENMRIPGTIGGETVQISFGDGQWYDVPTGGANSNDYAQHMSDAKGKGNVGIRYFPATFYLQSADELPGSYGYTGPTITGQRPQDEPGGPLVGYEIKPDNFVTRQAYDRAIQNFANWFTYYRKRHLATRGGIVAAFDRIGGMQAGHCTINNRRDIPMRNLDDDAERAAFYRGIFNIDYYSGGGTPNRKGLQFLGQQLEKNGGRHIITAPCQRNFAILFTDGYNKGGPSNSVGNVDDDYGPPFADNESNTIADVAMKYYKDLDTPAWQDGLLAPQDGCELANPDPSLDCETSLHMTTFGVTLGQQGTLYGTPAYPQDDPDPYSNPPDWPDPNKGSYGKEQIDDLWHAAVNSRGALLNANTPGGVANAFTGALEKILGAEGSASSISLNSASLTQNSVAYQASFRGGAWSGMLKALPQNTAGTGFDDPLWEASEQLRPENKDPDNRVMLINGSRNCGRGNDKTKATAFRYGAIKSCKDLTRAQVEYLRGDTSGERANDGEFRNRRGNLLGDIVHSNPLYVGAPNRYRYPRDWDNLRTEGNDNLPEDQVTRYNNPESLSFAQGTAASRTPMIYVGANDGMLHGFDAISGEEKLAFIPHAVQYKLTALTDPSYTHQYYVDGSPTAGDVVMDDAWRTVLVSGLRGGGRSVFALDVTDPAAFSEANAENIFLWEFTDPELGYTYGQPSIVRLHNGDWAAVFGNGYNSDSGNAQLFIVDIATGTSIRTIDTGAGPSRDSEPNCYYEADDEYECDDDDEEEDDDEITICYKGKTYRDDREDLQERLNSGATRGACGSNANTNGLGEVFPVDLDGDYITDYIYAGDLQGNLWQFDLTDSDDGNWRVGLSGKPLFTAPEPITAQPQVGIHPYGRDFGVMVYFGTGKYLETSDRRADTQVQNSFYGIWDLDVFTFNEANNGTPLFNTNLKSEVPRSRLVEQSIMDVRGSANDISYRLVSDNAVPYQTRSSDSEGKRGWVIDLPKGEGEMSVSNARIENTASGNTISFSTTVPNTATCAAGGSGFFMLLSAETGGRTGYPAFDINGDNRFNPGDDTFAVGSKQITASGMGLTQGVPGEATHQIDHRQNQAYYIIPASDGSIRRVLTPKPPDTRRSWREIRR